WLSNELLARRDLAGVWLKRGPRTERTEIRSAHRGPIHETKEDAVSVIIGVDPHKGSHTAVAIDRDEVALAEFKVRAPRRRVDQLLECAAPFATRSWAVETVCGL